MPLLAACLNSLKFSKGKILYLWSYLVIWQTVNDIAQAGTTSEPLTQKTQHLQDWRLCERAQDVGQRFNHTFPASGELARVGTLAGN